MDDDEQIRTLFRRLIEDVGYLVYEAESGRAAIHLLEDRFIDLMILDLSMPDQDGFETLRYTRRAWPDLKVVVISALMGGSLLQIAAAMGASATLDKIVAPQLLIPTICRVLGS